MVIPRVNDSFADHPTLTAGAVLARVLMEKSKAQRPVREGLKHLLTDLPAWELSRIDFTYWYFGSYAAFQYDGPKGLLWKKWKHPKNKAVLRSQNRERRSCRFGPWEPIDRWSAEGGRVYTTAMASLCLEFYYG